MPFSQDVPLSVADATKSRYRYIAFTSMGYRRFTQAEAGESLTTFKKPSVDPQLPAHGSYGALLFDRRWKEKRSQILIRDNHSCIHCKSAKQLQVHHRQYHFVVRDQQFKPPWDYDARLLITLCEPCHQKGHYRYKVPTIHL